MIWLRRTLAIPLTLIFIILTIPLLVIFRVNDTIGNPKFYISELRQADIYNFIYDEILPAALKEMKTDGDALGGFVSQLKPHIAPMVKEAIPPKWVQIQVEQVISQLLPYALGDTAGFRVSIPLKEEVGTAAQAVKNTLHKEGVFPSLYDRAVNLALEGTAPYLQGLPLSRDELKKAVATALPANWLLTQIDNAIGEIAPYLTGDEEHFTLRLDISSRLTDLETVVTDILRKQETYNYLFDNVLAPALKQNIQNMQFPMGITLTGDEVIGVAKEVLPLQWYQVQVASITGQIFSYLKGTRQTLEFTVDLADCKAVAASSLGQLANKKAGMDIGLLTSPIISGLLDGVPDQWTLGDAELRQLLGGAGGEDMLRQGRDLAQKGLTYTDSDLSASMGADYKTIEDIRKRIAGGFVFTEKELQSLMTGSGGGNAGGEFQEFDNMRRILGMVRRLLILVWLIPALILLAIGALGGRTWGSKLAWAASVLGITALIAYVIFGPVFSVVVAPQISQALAQAVSQTQGIATIAGKGATLAQSAIDSFIGGLKLETLGLLALSLVLIVLGSIWHRSQVS